MIQRSPPVGKGRGGGGGGEGEEQRWGRYLKDHLKDHSWW